MQTVASADDDRSRSSSAAGVRLAKLLRDIEVNVEKMKKDAKHLSPPDDEKWMEITPEDLDRLLDSYASRSDQETIRNAGDKAGPQEEHLGSEITQGLRKFVQHVSDYEGAELPAGKNKKPTNGARVDFDADSFGEAVSAILGKWRRCSKGYYREPCSDLFFFLKFDCSVRGCLGFESKLFHGDPNDTTMLAKGC